MNLKRILIGLVVAIFLIVIISLNFNSIFLQNKNSNVILVNRSASEIFGWGNNIYGQAGNSGETQVLSSLNDLQINDISEISAKGTHTLLLKADGTVITLGDPLVQKQNEAGLVKFENGDVLNEVKQLATNAHYSLALRNDGTVYSWGDNLIGQLGSGDNTSHIFPKKIEGLENIVYIAAGYKFGVALQKDGTLWGWGGSCDQVIAENASDILKKLNQSGGSISSLGGYYDPISQPSAEATEGQIFNDDPTAFCVNQIAIGFSSKVPVKLKPIPNVVKLSAGYGHTLALTAEGDVWAFGCNFYGQIQQSDRKSVPDPYKIPELTDVKDISAGYRHSLALGNDGNLYGWGANNKGEMGTGELSQMSPIVRIPLDEVEKISAGHDYSLVLKKNGSLWGFGENNFKILNSEDKKEYVNRPVQLFREYNFTALSAGTDHAIVIKK